jgi:hypothetical protein
VVEAGRGKYVRNNKYHAGGNQPKQIWLPASETWQLQQQQQQPAVSNTNQAAAVVHPHENVLHVSFLDLLAPWVLRHISRWNCSAQGALGAAATA